MEKIGTSIKTFTRRLSRKSSYDLEESDPTFKLKALSNGMGIRVFGTEPLHARQAVQQMMDLYGDQKGVDISLVLAGKNGVKVLDRNDKVLISYTIHEVVICFADKLYEDVFVFMGDKGSEIRCHAYRCGNVNRAQLICLTMAKMFQVHFDACAKQGGISSGSHEDVFVERVPIPLSGAVPILDLPHNNKVKNRRRSLMEGPTFSKYDVNGTSDAEARRRKSHNDVTSSTYVFMETDDDLFCGTPDSVEGIGDWETDSDNECLI